MYIYVVYPAISKCPKQLSNCLDIAEASVVSIISNGVLCDASAYTVTVCYCRSTRILYLKCFIRSMTDVYLPPLLELKIK